MAARIVGPCVQRRNLSEVVGSEVRAGVPLGWVCTLTISRGAWDGGEFLAREAADAHLERESQRKLCLLMF